MFVVWDMVIYNHLKRETEKITKDPEKKWLHDQFDEIEITQTDMKDFVKEMIQNWNVEPPEVYPLLTWERINEPGIYIDKGTEKIEGYIGNSQTYETKSTKTGYFEVTKHTITNPNLIIFLVSKNVWMSVHLFLIVRNLILYAWKDFQKLGVRNLSVTGGSLERNMPLLPNHLYAQQITISSEYDIEVRESKEGALGTDLTVANFPEETTEDEMSRYFEEENQ